MLITLGEQFGDRLWWTQTGTPFAKQKEGCEWEELYFHYREMSEAAGARNPSESQKEKALWAMKPSQFLQ